ncbi:MAG: hypothetical protein M1826_002746 [Phylliscum demangeonii]|nr:MAG: hypothetical protein M1826_002746 [Phylliscum demangeonii]
MASESNPTPIEATGPDATAPPRAIRVPKGRMKAGQSSGLPLPLPPLPPPTKAAQPAKLATPGPKSAARTTGASDLSTPPAQLAYELAKIAKESGEKVSATEWKKLRKERNREQKRLDKSVALAAGPSPSPSSSATPLPASPSPASPSPVAASTTKLAGDGTPPPTAATPPDEGAAVDGAAHTSPEPMQTTPNTVWRELDPSESDVDRDLFGDRALFDPRVHEVGVVSVAAKLEGERERPLTEQHAAAAVDAELGLMAVVETEEEKAREAERQLATHVAFRIEDEQVRAAAQDEQQAAYDRGLAAFRARLAEAQRPAEEDRERVAEGSRLAAGQRAADQAADAPAAATVQAAAVLATPVQAAVAMTAEVMELDAPTEDEGPIPLDHRAEQGTAEQVAAVQAAPAQAAADQAAAAMPSEAMEVDDPTEDESPPALDLAAERQQLAEALAEAMAAKDAAEEKARDVERRHAAELAVAEKAHDIEAAQAAERAAAAQQLAEALAEAMAAKNAAEEKANEIEAAQAAERAAAAQQLAEAIAEAMAAKDAAEKKAQDIERRHAADLAAAAAKIAELHAKLEAGQQESAEQTAKEVECQVNSERAAFVQQMAELKKELRAQENRANRKAMDLAIANMHVSGMRAEIKQGQQEVEAAGLQTMMLEEDLRHTRERAAEDAALLAAASQQIDALNARLEDEEDASAEVARELAEMKASEAEGVAALAKEYDELLADIARREADAVEAIQLFSDRPTVEFVEEQVQELRALTVRLRAENDHLVTTVSLQRGEHEAQVEELEREVSAERAKLRSAVSRLTQLEGMATEHKQAQADRERAAAKLARRFAKQLTAAQSKQETAEAEASTLRHQLVKTESRVSKWRHAHNVLFREYTGLRRKVRALEAEQMQSALEAEKMQSDRRVAERVATTAEAPHLHPLVVQLDADVAGRPDAFVPRVTDPGALALPPLVPVSEPVAAENAPNPDDAAAPVDVRPSPVRGPWIGRLTFLVVALLLAVVVWMSWLAAEKKRRLWASTNALPKFYQLCAGQDGETWSDKAGRLWAWAAGGSPGRG